MIRKVVDLPQPDGPSRQVTCPERTCSETPDTISRRSTAKLSPSTTSPSVSVLKPILAD
jgi:hypothetical protein